jgi:hypothetical protein
MRRARVATRPLGAVVATKKLECDGKGILARVAEKDAVVKESLQTFEAREAFSAFAGR